jgi:alpha-L-fucosidase
MRTYTYSFPFIILFLLTFNLAFSQEHNRYVPETEPLVLEKLEKWQDLKFGLLMHWGPYSQWGVVESWSICAEDEDWCRRKNPNYVDYVREYENLKTTFNPIKFDPDKWALAAKNAGMRYVVFTTKHHDGFCMFDTKYTDYKVSDKDCPFHSNSKSNIAFEIFHSFRNQGLWTGAYFSKPDWHCDDYWWPNFATPDRNPNYDIKKYPDRWEKYVQFTHNQILELMSDYGKMDILWLDGGWVCKTSDEEIKEWMAKPDYKFQHYQNQDIRMDELVQKARTLQPGLIVVDRAVEGKNQNYLTPENQVPDKALPYPWESCIISGGGWSWVSNAQYRSGHNLVHLLCDIVCKGGNLLLNIAPSPEGTWDSDAYQRLEEVGTWMKVNAEAIYETRAISPYKENKWCFTHNAKLNTVYAVYQAEESEIHIPASLTIQSFSEIKLKRVSLIGTNKSLKFKQSNDGIVIRIPENLQKNPPCKYAWAFRLEG